MYRSRLVLVTAFMALGLAVAAGLTMVPGYVAIQVIAPASEIAAPARSVEREDALALDRSQLLVNEVLPLLSATSTPIDTVEDALRLRPSGVRISRVTYSAGEDEDRITLTGSGTRGQVSAYRDALTGSGLFTGVAVPVSALVGSDESGFSIVLAGKF